MQVVLAYLDTQDKAAQLEQELQALRACQAFLADQDLPVYQVLQVIVEPVLLDIQDIVERQALEPQVFREHKDHQVQADIVVPEEQVLLEYQVIQALVHQDILDKVEQAVRALQDIQADLVLVGVQELTVSLVHQDILDKVVQELQVIQDLVDDQVSVDIVVQD